MNLPITERALGLLLSLLDELEPMPPAEGPALDAALATPAQGAATPEGAAIAVGAAQGVPPLDSLLDSPANSSKRLSISTS